MQSRNRSRCSGSGSGCGNQIVPARWDNLLGAEVRFGYYKWDGYSSEKGCQHLILNVSNNVRHELNQFKARCSPESAAPPVIVTQKKGDAIPFKTLSLFRTHHLICM